MTKSLGKRAFSDSLLVESGMSLLNDALRKKNKELKQPRKVNLFQNEPIDRRDHRQKKQAFLVLILVACIVVIWLVWLFFLQPDTSLRKPQISRNKIIETEPAAFTPPRSQVPLGPSREASAPDTKAAATESSNEAASAPDAVIATLEKQDSHEDDKGKPAQTGEQKSDDKQSIGSLEAKILKTGDERKGKERSPVPKGPAAVFSHGSEGPFYLKAVSYHRRNELAKAIQMYQQVLTKNPEHNGALFNLAAAYLNVSSFSEAYDILQKLHERDPQNPQILLNLAVAEIGLGRPQKAVSFLNESDALKGKPQFEICFHKGVAMSQLHMLNEAEIWYKRAEALNPGHPCLLFNMAVVYDKLERYPEALKYYGAFLKNEVAPSVHEKKEIMHRINAIRTYMAGQSSKH